MESPISNPVAKDFQVTGVSRSGRVRKKSSKLLDFESPEEIEKRAKRPGRQPARYPGRGRPPNALREREQELALAYEEDEEDDLEPNNSISDEEETSAHIGGAAVLMNSDDEVDTLVQDLVEGVEAEASYTNDSRVRQSLYMREKSNKRKILKDNKLQRKDKVRVRYTAYSLWAREVRKRDFPDLDFANAARRFSELWANVSHKEKNAWRRKAKVLATKARARDKNAPAEVATTLTPPKTINANSAAAAAAANTTDACFVNRATTSRTKKLAADRRQVPDQLGANTSTPSTWAQSRQKRNSNGRGKASPIAGSQTGPSTVPAARHGSGSVDMELSGKAVTQQSSIEAIDAAAHLKLLGESLTVIGERLKEHNGHVALSGSLSVLLDSLLCSMGPLLCMTTQIPGLENKKQLSTNLATTLDNIAYVMPGL
ncbi:FACT complex subunit SSRP1 [Drosophila montana]|uniref:FACT complex subunit SSRP1 n=1 Tax=Drosophila montana TaxID=40370 RepID=UPI00313E985A